MGVRVPPGAVDLIEVSSPVSSLLILELTKETAGERYTGVSPLPGRRFPHNLHRLIWFQVVETDMKDITPPTLHPIYGWLPLLICGLIILISVPSAEFYRTVIIVEDGLVEWATVLFALGAFALSAIMAWRFHQQRQYHIQFWLLVLYAFASFFFAGEEISWGQRLLGIEADQVPEWLAAANRQDEINIHNIQGFDKVRLLADAFCMVWGILVPTLYYFRPLPLGFLHPFLSPLWLIPAHLTTLLMTVPKKFVLYLLGEEYEFGKLWASLGEFKELSFAIVIMLFALHLRRRFRDEGRFG
ncbi:MAG: hypothetical protein ACOX5R_02175 [bacterium]